MSGKEQRLGQERESLLSQVRVDLMSVAHADTRRTAVEIFSSADITIRDAKVLTVNQPPLGEEAVIGGSLGKRDRDNICPTRRNRHFEVG